MLNLIDIAQLEFITYGIFTFGIITGLAVGGFVKSIIYIFSDLIRHPRRVLTTDGFLYRFRGKYYPLEEKISLTKQAIEKYRALRKSK